MTYRITVALLLTAALVASLPATAHAEEPPADRGPAASASAASTQAPIVRTSGDATCSMSERGDLPEIEARTAVDVVCGELGKQKGGAGRYTIGLGRLGSRTRLVVASGDQSREAWMTSLDELPTASARTAEAISTGRTVDETQNVDSVLASEATSRRTKSGQLGAGASLIGASTLGASSSLSTGFGLSLHYNVNRYAVVAEGRAVGIGSSDAKLTEVSAGIGFQMFSSDSDLSPFVGGGLQVAYYQLTADQTSGSGAGAFAELGVAGLRSSKVGVFASARAALPFFRVAPSGYVAPVTLNLGLTFL